MLQAIKAQWPNRRVALDVKGKPFYTFTSSLNSDWISQSDDVDLDRGWYTVFSYAKALFDPAFGDDVRVN